MRVWQSDEALWANAVAVTPNQPRAHLNLGTAIFHADRQDAAIIEYQIARRLMAGRPARERRLVDGVTRADLAVARILRGEAVQGKADLASVLRDYPAFSAVRELCRSVSCVPDLSRP